MTPGRYGGNIGHGGPKAPWVPPAIRQIHSTPCPNCNNHFIHSKNCPNYKPGSSGVFKWPADSADN